MDYVLIGLGLGGFALLYWLVDWLSKRPTRVLATETDPELGPIGFTEVTWDCSNPVVLAGLSIKLSGTCDGTSITDAQRKTIDYLRGALAALIPKAIAAGEEYLKELQPALLKEDRIEGDPELALDFVSIQEAEGDFELWLKSPRKPNPIPWGLIVGFSREKVVNVEYMH